MPGMIEREIDQLLVKRAQIRGIDCIKVMSVAHRGLPDRMLLGPGKRFGFVEVKRQRSPLTDLQRMMHHKLEDSGVWVAVLHGSYARADTLESIENLLDEYITLA